jgi:REP element-mobilizing transposase RayT
MEHSPRLHRLDRLYIRAPIYFVTACTHERQPLLANAEAHAAFLTFARAAYGRGVAVGRYVLMPDHLHLFVRFAPDALALSDWMKSLKNFLSKLCREQGKAAPHWQKGFFDHIIRSEESYSEKWAYVMENPVRKKLVARAEDWPYAGEVHVLRAGDL